MTKTKSISFVLAAVMATANACATASVPNSVTVTAPTPTPYVPPATVFASSTSTVNLTGIKDVTIRSAKNAANPAGQDIVVQGVTHDPLKKLKLKVTVAGLQQPVTTEGHADGKLVSSPAQVIIRGIVIDSVYGTKVEVEAVDQDGITVNKTEYVVPSDAPIPLQVTNLKVSPTTEGGITGTFSLLNDIGKYRHSYEVHLTDAAGNALPKELLSVGVNSFTISPKRVFAGATYTLRVRGINDGGQPGPDSDPQTVTTEPLEAPRLSMGVPTANGTFADARSIKISWAKGRDNLTGGVLKRKKLSKPTVAWDAIKTLTRDELLSDDSEKRFVIDGKDLDPDNDVAYFLEVTDGRSWINANELLNDTGALRNTAGVTIGRTGSVQPAPQVTGWGDGTPIAGQLAVELQLDAVANGHFYRVYQASNPSPQGVGVYSPIHDWQPVRPADIVGTGRRFSIPRISLPVAGTYGFKVLFKSASGAESVLETTNPKLLTVGSVFTPTPNPNPNPSATPTPTPTASVSVAPSSSPIFGWATMSWLNQVLRFNVAIANGVIVGGFQGQVNVSQVGSQTFMWATDRSGWLTPSSTTPYGRFTQVNATSGYIEYGLDGTRPVRALDIGNQRVVGGVWGDLPAYASNTNGGVRFLNSSRQPVTQPSEANSVQLL